MSDVTNDNSNNADSVAGGRASPPALDVRSSHSNQGASCGQVGETRNPGHAPTGSTARWWLGVTVGTAVSLPFGWLLSHTASLPYYLGLFFFVLFGLVVGAIIHRVAAPRRPYTTGVILAGSTVVVLVGWAFSIAVEGHALPAGLADIAARSTLSLGDRTLAEYHDYIADQVRGFLRDDYPPGGTIGYVHWVLTSGEITKGRIESVRRTLRQPQRKVRWAVRVVLSVGLWAFGIASQTLLLRQARDPAAVRVSEIAPDTD